MTDSYINPLGIILIATLFVFPIGGWLADAYTGRYKMIRYSMRIMWAGVVLVTLSELVTQWSITYEIHIRNAVLYTLSVAVAVGFGGFQSNIVQLGISQLMDASTIEITSFITWYVLTLYISGVTLQSLTYCLDANYSDSNQLYTRTFVVAVCLTVAVCSDFLFHHWLTKEQVTQKSMNLIFKVIKFTIKHRRSFKYEDKLQSRFNVAKHIYGGPFSNQQVEDVKSMLWITTVIAVCSIVSGGTTLVEYATDKILHQNLQLQQDKNGLTGCYRWYSIQYSDYLFTIGYISIYEFALFPMFRKCLPTLKITTRFLLGIMLFLFRIVALLSLEAATYYNEQHTSNLTNSSDISESTCIFTHRHNVEDISYKWLLIPGFMSGLSSFFMFLSGIEFIWAQTPYSMTGLALGIMYACIGLNTLLQSVVAYPFLFSDGIPWEHYPLTCQLWYFLLQGLITLIMLTVGILVFKKYKRRTRNDSSINSFTQSEIHSGPFC